jgi:type I restriction enzyme S subunit
MKTEWPTRQLGEISVIGAGNSAPQKEELFEDGTIPFFRTSDAGRIRFGDIYEAEDLLNERGATGLRRFPIGTILFPKSGASTFLNHRVMLGVEGCVSSHLATIVAKQEQIDARFLLYFLSTVQTQDLVQDHSYPSLNLPTISGIQVPVPPLEEQKRIVGVLDQAFEGIAATVTIAENNLRNARALFDSHLQTIFSQKGEGWVETRLGDIADFKNGLNFTRQSKGQTLQMVGVGDFQNLSIVPVEGLQSVTIDGTLSEDYLIKKDDILLVRSNGSRDLVGRCMLVPDVNRATSFSGFIIRLRFDSSAIAPRFLLHFMKSSSTRDRLTRDGGGANISNINQAKLSTLPIYVPPLKDQQKIVSQLDAFAAETQKLERIYERKLTALAELKKSLLHQAFSGAL